MLGYINPYGDGILKNVCFCGIVSKIDIALLFRLIFLNLLGISQILALAISCCPTRIASFELSKGSYWLKTFPNKSDTLFTTAGSDEYL